MASWSGPSRGCTPEPDRFGTPASAYVPFPSGPRGSARRDDGAQRGSRMVAPESRINAEGAAAEEIEELAALERRRQELEQKIRTRSSTSASGRRSSRPRSATGSSTENQPRVSPVFGVVQNLFKSAACFAPSALGDDDEEDGDDGHFYARTPADDEPSSQALAEAQDRLERMQKEVEALRQERERERESLSTCSISSGGMLGFSAAELEAMRGDVDPTKLPDWLSMIGERLSVKSLEAQQLFRCTADDARDRLEHPQEGERWRAVDKELSSVLVALIDRKSEHAEDFFASVASKPGVLSSGTAIKQQLLISTEATTSFEYTERKLRLEQQPYFKMGMTDLETKRAARLLQRDWCQTPAGRQDDSNDLMQRLISKFPRELSPQAEKYSAETAECEILGKSYPWSYQQLVQILSVLLRRHVTVQPAAFDANATEQRGGGGGEPNNSIRCQACGKPGHRTGQCPTVCDVCGERACPGNAGKDCIVCSAVDIPATVTDALGRRPMPDWARYVLVEAQQRIRAKQAAAKTAAAGGRSASHVEVESSQGWTEMYKQLRDDEVNCNF